MWMSPNGSFQCWFHCKQSGRAGEFRRHKRLPISSPKDKWRHPKVTPLLHAVRRSLLAAEGEVQAGEILEVVLAAGVAGAVDAEAGVEVVHFDWPQLDVRGEGVIEAAAELHGESIVVAAGRNQSGLGGVDLAVQVAMCRTKQSLSEGLQFARVLLDLGAEHVSEDIAIGLACIAQSGQLVLQAAALGVAGEIGLNADPRGHVIHKAAAATEDVETGELADAGVNVDKRKAHRNFELGVILCYCRHGDQKRKCDNHNPLLHCLPLLIQLELAP